VTEPDRPTPVDPAELGFEAIVYEKAPPRATITLNRPEVLNAFDFRMLREIARACEDASWDDEIRVVVVTGAGRAFCVGADLKSWSEEYLGKPGEYWKWFGAFKDMHDRLREIGKPTLARINGICVGGGNELQMACDLAVIVEDAFIRHVGPEHGSVPAGGATQWLPVMVGDRRAREILLLCEEISAAKATEWGLVNSAFPRDQLDAEVDRLVESLAAKLPQTVRYTKQQLNFWRDLSWHETVNHARDWLALSMATDEPREAVEKFLARVEGEWAGIVQRQDKAAADRFLADDYVLTSVGGVSRHMPRQIWIDSLPGIQTELLEADVENVRTYGDVAVVKARLRWLARAGDRNLNGTYAVTDVFTNDQGRWRASWRISVRLTDR
jgi:enoyl-CoA hydratase/carnithine racemase